jgi:hypothetical protein
MRQMVRKLREATRILNVFTVEEYESNAKTGKRWTTIGAAFPTKKASASASSSRPFS